MRSLELNLATRPFKNNTLLWLGYGLAAVLLVLFTTSNVLSYRASHRKLSELSRTMVNIEQENRNLVTREQRARRGIAAFDVEFLERQAGKANEVIEWKAFSWTRLFNRMAEIQPQHVKMASIRPVLRSTGDAGAEFTAQGRAESIPVLVDGIARSFSALWEFQNALMAATYFGRVEPERLNRGDQDEVVFELRFEYYPVDDEPPAEQETPVEEGEAGEEGKEEEGQEEEEIVQTVSDPLPAGEPEPDRETSGEPPAAEPPRRQLPPVVHDDEDPEDDNQP